MQPVKIYTTPFCPYCVRAKSLLGKKGVAYEEVDVMMDDKARDEMLAKSGGARTVPQIFIGETHVGGCDELYALDATASSIRCWPMDKSIGDRPRRCAQNFGRMPMKKILLAAASFSDRRAGIRANHSAHAQHGRRPRAAGRRAPAASPPRWLSRRPDGHRHVHRAGPEGHRAGHRFRGRADRADLRRRRRRHHPAHRDRQGHDGAQDENDKRRGRRPSAKTDQAFMAQLMADPAMVQPRQGGEPIMMGATLIGAIAVSGAPSGGQDEPAARPGLAKIQDRIH